MKRLNNSHKKAFTIIEFMLAMTTLSILLVSIAAITIHIVDIYKKGLATRAVNSTGRDILNDLKRTIGSSPISFDINPEGEDGEDIDWPDILTQYRKYYNESTVEVNGKTTQAGGVFCTGAYSYIWNTAPVYEAWRTNKSSTLAKAAYTINGSAYRFARIPDATRKTCETVSETDTTLVTKSFTVSNTNTIVSLIGDDETDLALYDFVVLPATQNGTTSQIFYSGSFILATIKGGINIQANGDYCTGSEKMFGTDYESASQNLDYCAINKFNFAVRATGETDASQDGEG